MDYREFYLISFLILYSIFLNGQKNNSRISFNVRAPDFLNDYSPPKKQVVMDMIKSELENHILTLCPNSINLIRGYRDDDINIQVETNVVSILSQISGDYDHVKVKFIAELPRGQSSAISEGELRMNRPALVNDVTNGNKLRNTIVAAIDNFLNITKTSRIFADLSVPFACHISPNSKPGIDTMLSMQELESRSINRLKMTKFDSVITSPVMIQLENTKIDSIFFQLTKNNNKIVDDGTVRSNANCAICISNSGTYIMNVEQNSGIFKGVEFFVNRPNYFKKKNILLFGGAGLALTGVFVEKLISRPKYKSYLITNDIDEYDRANQDHHIAFISFWTGIVAVLSATLWDQLEKKKMKDFCKKFKVNIGNIQGENSRTNKFGAKIIFTF